MGKIAFILEGKENSGKTSTIKEVVKKIYNNEKQIEIENVTMREDDKDFCNKTDKTFRTTHLDEVIKILEQQLNKSKDIGLIIQFNNGIKIGIESEGDPDSKKKEKLLSSLEKFKEEKCDIILCAIRSSKSRLCYSLYRKVKWSLGNINMEVKLSRTDAKMKLDYEYLHTTLSNINNKDIYKRIWITNIYEEDKGKQAECNEKSAELIYELIEKAIKELSE